MQSESAETTATYANKRLGYRLAFLTPSARMQLLDTMFSDVAFVAASGLRPTDLGRFVYLDDEGNKRIDSEGAVTSIIERLGESDATESLVMITRLNEALDEFDAGDYISTDIYNAILPESGDAEALGATVHQLCAEINDNSDDDEPDDSAEILVAARACDSKVASGTEDSEDATESNEPEIDTASVVKMLQQFLGNTENAVTVVRIDKRYIRFMKLKESLESAEAYVAKCADAHKMHLEIKGVSDAIATAIAEVTSILNSLKDATATPIRLGDLFSQ